MYTYMFASLCMSIDCFLDLSIGKCHYPQLPCKHLSISHLSFTFCYIQPYILNIHSYDAHHAYMHAYLSNNHSCEFFFSKLFQLQCNFLAGIDGGLWCSYTQGQQSCVTITYYEFPQSLTVLPRVTNIPTLIPCTLQPKFSTPCALQPAIHRLSRIFAASTT